MKHLIALLLLTTSATAQTLPGFDRLAVDAPHRPRPLEAAVWYPAASETYTVPLGANPAFVGTKVQVGPAVQPGPHPLVILSHGSGGNIENLGWLAAGLVARGAIVAGVNHPGATSGDSSPRQLPRIIDRTQDLQALIATLTTDPAFAPAIDPAQITALGFSLGGATVLAAGGARFDIQALAAYCDRYGTDASECAFMARGGMDASTVPPVFAAEMTVPGLARIIAVDPALTHTLVEPTLANLPPLHLIRMGTESVSPPPVTSAPLEATLPRAFRGRPSPPSPPPGTFPFLASAHRRPPPCCRPRAKTRSAMIPPAPIARWCTSRSSLMSLVPSACNGRPVTGVFAWR